MFRIVKKSTLDSMQAKLEQTKNQLKKAQEKLVSPELNYSRKAYDIESNINKLQEQEKSALLNMEVSILQAKQQYQQVLSSCEDKWRSTEKECLQLIEIAENISESKIKDAERQCREMLCRPVYTKEQKVAGVLSDNSTKLPAN